MPARLHGRHVGGAGRRLVVGGGRLHRGGPRRLAGANILALSLSEQGKCAEAEQMQREVLEAQKRVLGSEHSDTLIIAGNLAISLYEQDKYAEAE